MRGLRTRSVVAILAMLAVQCLFWIACDDPSSVTVAAEECPNETCLAGYQCGGQYGTAYPPGVMSFCSPSQVGASCNWCDGTAVVRVCTSLVQARKCDRPTAKSVCGDPKVGVCKKTHSYILGVDIYWCKDSGAAGSHKCDVTEECTGDTACKPKS